MIKNRKIAVSVIIVHYKAQYALFDCLKSLKDVLKVTKTAFEVILVDNDEKKTIEDEIKRDFSFVKYIKSSSNIGFGSGNNLGAEKSQGEILFFLNPDTVVLENAIDKLVSFINKDKKTGIVSPLLLDRNKVPYKLQGTEELTPLKSLFSLSFISKYLPNNPVSRKYWNLDWDGKSPKKVCVVPGTSIMIRKEVFNRIGGFDKRFFLYFEEFDLCKKLMDLGYDAYIIPSAKVIHFWGESTKYINNKDEIFAKSRFLYFKKNYGLLKALSVEVFLRFFRKETFLLTCIFCFSLFLNLYRISDLMMFYGDFGRDYLAARDMILTGNIPLVGITSSVTWLHQGPLSIYFIGIALLIGNFHPVAPAILYGIIGAFSSVLVYFLGKYFINRTVGYLASIFFATSPLVVVSARMPYHTSSIPLFSGFFFLLLLSVIKGKYELVPLLAIVFGLLLQLELSNFVLIFVTVALLFIYKLNIKRISLRKTGIGLLLGIFPFIIYDFSHNFVQTGGLMLWTINRVRLFFGLTLSGHSTTSNTPNALFTIWQTFERIIFPTYSIIVILVVILFFVLIFLRMNKLIDYKKNIGLILCLFWVFVPLIGFFIHAAPGSAYFPLIFPGVCILLGFTLYELSRKLKYVFIFFTFIVFGNIYFLVNNDYYMTTSRSVSYALANSFNLGFDFKLRDDIAQFIAKDSKGETIRIKGGGFLSKYSTGANNYQYLVWLHGGREDKKVNHIYIIYENPSEIKENANIAYRNKFIFVVKDEVR